MKKVLVTRREDDFSRILAANGFRVINLPLIETAELKDLSEFEMRLAALESYDGVFLTSAVAAQIFRAKLSAKKIAYRGNVYVLGRRSFDILKTENLDLVFDETANTAREMLGKVAPETLKNKRFLFVRGTKSLGVVPELLTKTAAVDEAVVYETREITVGSDEMNNLREKFATSEIACACFFSPSGAESFLKQFAAEILHQTRIATIGKTTAEFFARQNLTVDFVSPKTTAEDFAVGLVDLLKSW